MSNRSLLELNHDYCPNSMNDRELRDWARDMAIYMGSGDARDLPPGVAFKNMRHHSDVCPLDASAFPQRMCEQAGTDGCKILLKLQLERDAAVFASEANRSIIEAAIEELAGGHADAALQTLREFVAKYPQEMHGFFAGLNDEQKAAALDCEESAIGPEDGPKRTINVVTMREHNSRDTTAFLRQIADSIDAGSYGAVGEVAMVVMGDTVEVFGFGPAQDATSTASLLQAGNMRQIYATLRMAGPRREVFSASRRHHPHEKRAVL